MNSDSHDLAVRSTLHRMGVAYAFSWAATSMVAGPGSAALVQLTGNLSHSGMYIALAYLSGAAGAALGGKAMDRFGRKPPLLTAYLCSATGFLIAGTGVALAEVPLFMLGIFLFSAAFGTINLTRLAAAEMFIASERGKGVAWIQLSAVFGAVSGPLLLLASAPLSQLLGRPPLELVWFIAPPLLLCGAIAISTAMEPRLLAIAASPAAAPSTPAAPTTPIAPAAPKASTSAIAVATNTPIATLRAATAEPSASPARLAATATVTLAASQGAMAAVMGVAGAAVSHAGHGVNVLGGLMFLHFMGMFGLSRVFGRLADQIGRKSTMMAGILLLGLGGAVVAIFQNAAGFGIGLLLVGMGWSSGFIGSTVLITDATVPQNRASIMGRADLSAQLLSAVIAVFGGWWFARHGVGGLGLVAIAVVIIPAVMLARLHESSPGEFR